MRRFARTFAVVLALLAIPILVSAATTNFGDVAANVPIYTAAQADAQFATLSHAHAASDVTSGTLDGDRLPAISTTKRGGVPATGTPSGLFLKDDGTWAAAGGGVTDGDYGDVSVSSGTWSIDSGVVTEGDLSISDVTTGNVTSTAHGFVPKSPSSSIQFLNGAATPTFSTVPGRYRSTTTFTSGSSSSWAPSSGTSFVYFRIVGGGGAGGSADGGSSQSGCGAGGGGGAYVEGWYSVVAGRTWSYSVGAGGTPGSAGNNAGGNGSDTTFGDGVNTFTAKGGTGGGSCGASGTSVVRAAPGSPQSGTTAVGSGVVASVPPSWGLMGLRQSGTVAWGGQGGDTPLGHGGAPGYGANGEAGNGYGGGGGGGQSTTTTDRQGGAGAAGVVIVCEFY